MPPNQKSIVNKVTIDKMKKVAYIVNTVHRSLLEIVDLHATLDSGKITGVPVDKAVSIAVDNLLKVFK